jgi:hypothetical protein
MLRKKKFWIVAGGLICAVAVAVGAAVSLSTSARAQTDAFRSFMTEAPVGTPPNGAGPVDYDMPGPGFPGKGRMPGKEANNTYLADALGITLDEMQAAYQAAWQKGIDQALSAGLITEAQANWMKENGAGMNGRGSLLGEWLGENNALDMNALLAEQLGISVEELQAARQKASDAALQATIDSGELTQAQADLVGARQALAGHIDHQALTAEALGVTVEQLDAARAAGKTMPDLLQEQGLTQEEFQANMQAAYQKTVNQAVQDGVITQAQADLLLSADAGPGPIHGPGFLPGDGKGGPPGQNCP